MKEFEIKTHRVKAETRKLKVRWSPELSQDIKSYYHHIDKVEDFWNEDYLNRFSYDEEAMNKLMSSSIDIDIVNDIVEEVMDTLT